MSDQNVLTELLVKVLSAFDEASSKQALALVDKQQDQITGREKKGQADRTKNLAASLATGLKHVEGYTKGALGFAEKITLGFASVVTAIEGGAVAGTFALAKLSKGLSDAYYSGQKVGAAVKDMEAFRFASEQMGSSAEKAQAGINELGHLRNTNPGAYIGLLQRLGVAATDAAGKLRSPAQAAMDLAPALAKLPRQMQLLYGNQLGMDDDQTLAMTRPEFLAKVRQFKEMQASMGFDPDKAAEDGAKFQQVWGHASAALDIITKKIESAFLGRVGGSLDKVTTWVVKNADRITTAVVRVGDFVVHLATSFVDLVTSFDKLSPSAQHFLEVLGGLVALSLTLRSGPIGAIMALAAAVAFLWDDYEKYKEGLPSIVDWASWEPKIKAAIDGLTSLWTKFDELSKKLTGQGGLQVAMEAFAVYMAGAWVARILGAFGAVGSGWLGLLARIGLLNPAVLGTAAVGAVLASGDPDKIPLVGQHPDVQPQDSDTGLPGVDDRKSGMGDAEKKAGGFLSWFKKAIGWGDRLHEDPRVKDAILATAEATKKLVEKADRAGVDGGEGGGVMGAANRFLGWAGRALGGGAGRGDGAPLHFAGFGNGGWEKSGANKQEVADYIRHAAAAAGIDPDVALRVARSEGLGTYTGDYGTSFGPFQLHYGGSGIRGMNSGGLGDRFTKETGLDARDPKTWRAQVDYAMKMAKREGWGAWHGAAHVGIGNRQGLDYHGPVPPAPSPTSPGAGTPAPSGPAITDAEVFAARQRIINGSRDPKDRALIDRYRAQQNTPKAAAPAAPAAPAPSRPSTPAPAPPAPAPAKPHASSAHPKPVLPATPTKHGRDHDGVRTVDIPETSPSGQPVKVEVTDGSAAKIGGHVGKQFPSWMTRGRDGQAYQTTDMRDPKHAPFHPDDDRATRARRSDHWWGSTALHFAHGGGDNPLTDLYRSGWAKHMAVPGGLMASSASLYRAYDKAPGGGAGPVVNQHIAINGIQNPKDIEHHLKVHAKRGVQDTLRHMQGPSQ